MYDFVDRPVTNLDRGGRFLIWSMRVWARTLGQRRCPASAIAPAFAQWKMIGALQPFHHAMLLFNRDGLETLQFCALGCNRISEHEAIILSLVCALRDGQPLTVRDTLALLVAEDSIGDLLGAICAIGDRMDEAEIFPCRSA